ncbi:hypothetical protein [Fibrella forsythiae]|uniref:Uncharacterized protein n=1 Tax=Fibrella forsythiae TaxID=2817061 RepID=A0ABS3JSM4_9BACT|nr:hypothetical protein [Fibrella forsythiae]MBO0953014.1 hypothetical protein [Fibrella forsythiae]
MQGQLVRSTIIKHRPIPDLAPAAYQLESHQPMADERGEAFLRSRALDPLALKPYLTDVYFTPANAPGGPLLYGLGLLNASGGFELRSPLRGTVWRKLSVGPKDISAFTLSPTAAWLCFEGMPDFGSFLTVDRPPVGTFNYLILNGTGMTTRATEFLATQPPGSLILCSQADPGAQRVKKTLLAWAIAQGWQTGDIDHKWQGHQDYNAWLMAGSGGKTTA